MKNKSFLRKFSWIFMILLGLSVSFSMSSCGDDDDDDNEGNPKTEIVGSWKAHKITVEDSFGDNFSGELPLGTGYTVDFNADGTGKYVEIFEGKVEESNTFTYTLDGNILTLTEKFSDGDVETSKAEVKKLTHSELVIYEYEEYDGNWEAVTMYFDRIK